MLTVDEFERECSGFQVESEYIELAYDIYEDVQDVGRDEMVVVAACMYLAGEDSGTSSTLSYPLVSVECGVSVDAVRKCRREILNKYYGF